MIDLES